MKGVSWVGSTAVLIPVLLVVGGVLVTRRRDSRSVALLGITSVEPSRYDVIKPLVGRVRPPATLDRPLQRWRFPLGTGDTVHRVLRNARDGACCRALAPPDP